MHTCANAVRSKELEVTDGYCRKGTPESSTTLKPLTHFRFVPFPPYQSSPSLLRIWYFRYSHSSTNHDLVANHDSSPPAPLSQIGTLVEKYGGIVFCRDEVNAFIDYP